MPKAGPGTLVSHSRWRAPLGLLCVHKFLNFPILVQRWMACLEEATSSAANKLRGDFSLQFLVRLPAQGVLQVLNLEA